MTRLNLRRYSHTPPGKAKLLFDDVLVAGAHHRIDICESFIYALEGKKPDKDTLEIDLLAEPNNPYDENAIMVIASVHGFGLLGLKSKKYHIGYIPKGLAPIIHKESPNYSAFYTHPLSFKYSKNAEYPIDMRIDIYGIG